MDNLTHTLFGAALVRTPLGRLSPLAAGVLLVGANLPDVDVVSGFLGREVYLEHHRGLTHALVGVLAQVFLLVMAARRIELWRARRSGSPPPAGHLRLWVLCAAAVGSHPLLDLLNVYGLRPWLPFDGRWYYGDLLFIVDPWLWLLLAAAAWLGGPPRRGLELLVALLLGLGLVVLVIAPPTPTPVRVLWPVAAGLLALLGSTRPKLVRPRPVLVACALLLAAQLGAMALLGRSALRTGLPAVRAALEPGEVVQRFAHAPTAADPLRWQVLVLTQAAAYVQDVRVGRGAGALVRFDRRSDDLAVRRALEDPCGLAWSRFARFPFARTAEDPGGRLVQLSDVRFLVGARSKRPEDPPVPEWFTQELLVREDDVLCLPQPAGWPRRPSR